MTRKRLGRNGNAPRLWGIQEVCRVGFAELEQASKHTIAADRRCGDRRMRRSVGQFGNEQSADQLRPTVDHLRLSARCERGDVTLNQGFFQKSHRNISDSDRDQTPVDLGHQTAGAMAEEMVQRLEALGFVANKVTRGTQLSGDNVIVVDGFHRHK